MRASQLKREVDTSDRSDPQVLGSESVSIRNYDSAETHTITVRFTHTNDETVVNRSVTVGPSGVSSLRLPLKRAVYHVEVTCDDETSDSAECLIGNNPGECAVIESGNGIVSVTTGYHTRRS